MARNKNKKLQTEANNIDIVTLNTQKWVTYNDGDIVIIDDISAIKHKTFSHTYVNMVIMLFCLKGHATVTVNNKEWEAAKNDVLICTPNCFIDNYSLSKDFDAKIVGFSMDAIDSSIQISKKVWHGIYYLSQNPVVQLKEKDMSTLIHYYSIVKTKLKHKNNIFYSEIMHSLLRCIIYEFLIITDNHHIDGPTLENYDIKQADVLFRKFIELLSNERGMIRSVSVAAERLNVSGKYLSASVKQASGKKALQFIHHYTMQEIIRRLKYTDKSIQEICNDMNFPSISFFGKFFKEQMGIPPKQYRKRIAESINSAE